MKFFSNWLLSVHVGEEQTLLSCSELPRSSDKCYIATFSHRFGTTSSATRSEEIRTIRSVAIALRAAALQLSGSK